MEDKRTAIAILICMFIFMFWMEVVMAPYNRKPITAPQVQQINPQNNSAELSSAVQASNNQQIAPIQSQQVSSNTAPTITRPNKAQINQAGFINIESDLIRASISKLGGRFSSFSLKEYKAHLGKEELLDIISSSESGPLPLGVYLGTLSDEQVKYELISPKLNSENIIINSDELLVQISGQLPNGATITKTFTFNKSSYLFNLSVKLSSPANDGSRAWIEWSHFDHSVAASNNINHYSLSLLDAANKVRLMQLTEITQPTLEVGLNQWISYGDKYFMATLISSNKATESRVGRDANVFFTRLSGDHLGGDFRLFIGPKIHEDLRNTGYQLERNVDLGWFSFVAHPLLSLLNLFYRLLGNYGLAIILLTLVIKGIFLPLTKSSFVSMKAMQDLQPEMKALRERIQDPAQLNKEVMSLYKKHGVNPMGGCLPMFIQLPVFLGLYNALNYSLELRHAPFALWINDLSSPERLELFGMGIPVMVLLMGASMFIQQVTTPSAADPQQKRIMLMMPIIFTISFVIFPFPSGLVLYWLVNNLISIVQQMHLRSGTSGAALRGTIIASTGIFCFGYLLTLL